MSGFEKIVEAWQLIIHAEELMSTAFDEIAKEHNIEEIETKQEIKDIKPREYPQKKYYNTHKDIILEKSKAKYKTEEEKQKKKEYYQKHREELKAKSKERYNRIKSSTNIYTNGSGEPTS